MAEINLIGREILGYTIKEKLGSGAYGTVYRVEKENDAGRFIRALKHITFPTRRQYNSLLNSMGGDVEKVDLYFSEVQKNILSEVKILNNLTESGTPNVVRYYENDIRVSENPKHYDIFILMEYLTPLDDFIAENHFCVRDVIQLGEDILKGLAACHASGVIHRDVKNENIFVYVNHMTGKREYKIGDFGVSKEMRGSSRAESSKGTPDFLAPEVFTGKNGYTKSVDLYSMGIVLYRLLNYNRAPFLPRYPEQYYGEDEEKAFQRRMNGELPELPSLGGESLGRVILRAISGETERFPNAEEFLGELRKAATVIDQETLGTAIQIHGQAFRRKTEHDATKRDDTLDKDIDDFQNRDNNVNVIFPQDYGQNLSLYAVLKCRDCDLKKIREWQVSTPEGMISVQLPENVKDGQQIPYQGKGRMDPYTGQRGTLYVTVTIKNTTLWERYKELLMIIGGAAAAIMMILVVVSIIHRKTGDTDNLTEPILTESPHLISTESNQTDLTNPPRTEPPQTEPLRTEPPQTEHIHTWEEATYDRPKTCTVCGATEGEPLPRPGLRFANKLACGDFHTLGLSADGTVQAVGRSWQGQCDVSDWSNILEVAGGNFHTVGLKRDGTAVAVGTREHHRCDVEGWTDLVSVAAGGRYSVGLCADGTVVWTDHYPMNQDQELAQWEDIVAITAGERFVAGLRADGTVVAAGDNDKGQCDVEGWSDIVSIAAGHSHLLGLRSDGTVVSSGWNRNRQREVSGWSEIVAIAAGEEHSLGLHADGTVVAAGSDAMGQCQVGNWDNISAIAAGAWHSVGVRYDGTLVACGMDRDGACDVENFTPLYSEK